MGLIDFELCWGFCISGCAEWRSLGWNLSLTLDIYFEYTVSSGQLSLIENHILGIKTSSEIGFLTFILWSCDMFHVLDCICKYSGL